MVFCVWLNDYIHSVFDNFCIEPLIWLFKCLEITQDTWKAKAIMHSLQRFNAKLFHRTAQNPLVHKQGL